MRAWYQRAVGLACVLLLAALVLRSGCAADSTVQWPVLEAPLVGNRRTQIYHAPWCPSYRALADHNRVVFRDRAQAEASGYRRARNCPETPSPQREIVPPSREEPRVSPPQ